LNERENACGVKSTSEEDQMMFYGMEEEGTYLSISYNERRNSGSMLKLLSLHVYEEGMYSVDVMLSTPNMASKQSKKN